MNSSDLRIPQTVRTIKRFIEFYKSEGAAPEERLTLAQFGALTQAIEGLETYDRLEKSTAANPPEWGCYCGPNSEPCDWCKSQV